MPPKKSSPAKKPPTPPAEKPSSPEKTATKKAAKKPKTANTKATTGKNIGAKAAGVKRKSPNKANTLKVVQESFFNDRTVELRGHLPLNAYTVVQVQQGLVMQRLAKDGDGDTETHIKLILGPAEANKYRFQDQAALADTMVLVRGKVDTVIRSALDVDGLKAFLSATGKRFMTAGAELYMGVVSHTSPYDKNRGQQVRRKLFNDYVRDLMLRVHEASGESNLTKIYQDLLSARGLSALEALYYGQHGLIDGILMGQNEVITRDILDKLIQQKKLKGDALKNFLRYYINVYQVPTTSLKNSFPACVSKGITSLYQSLVNDEKPDKKQKSKTKKEPPQPQFHRGEKPMDKLPLVIRPHKDKPYRRLLVRQLPKTAGSFLEEDTLFFQDGFTDETAQQIGDALRALDHKKLGQGDKTPIKIVINSPGGSVWSGQELRSLIRSLGTPVDVITVGMAASCGSWLLSSATGSRLATPQARIMIHEAATQLSDRTPHNHYNEMHDDLDQSTQNYVAIVAEATGRPFEEVLRDFDLDVWFNPLEALYYGPKGMIDGIIVGPHHVLTKAQVTPALEKALGGKKAFADYIELQLAKKRDPRQMMAWRPEDHDLDDPFTNPLQWIHHLSSGKLAGLEATKTLGQQVISLTGPNKAKSKATPSRSVDYFTVVLEK